MPWLHNTSSSFILAGVPFSQGSPRRKIIRGVISDGYQWVFIILHLNENGKGGGYWITDEMPIGSGYDHLERIESPKPDVIAGILAHWVRRHSLFQQGVFTNLLQVQHCYDDIDENDWFVRGPREKLGAPY